MDYKNLPTKPYYTPKVYARMVAKHESRIWNTEKGQWKYTKTY